MNHPTRREFCAALGAGALSSSRAVAAVRPNVILVMTDDQGYGDLACHGNTVIQTPNLDRLHSQSVRFTNFHVDPLCSPTRSALMTGRYSCRTGVWSTVLGRSILRRDEVTMGDVFTGNGYRTAMFGKWHLGDNYPYRPEDRGFQETVHHGGGGIGQAPDYWGNSYFNDTYVHNGKLQKYQGYCTDVFFDNLLRFTEENRSRPFFVYVPTNAAHSPFNVAQKYSKPYEAKGMPEQLAKFYGMISNIDENMGRLMDHLKKNDLEQNTLLIWMTDNGTSGSGFNAGMRQRKGSPYEGGHRVPCFVRWPAGGIQGGRDVDRLAAHIDLLPSLIDLAGLSPREGPAFDGISVAPLLTEKGSTQDRTLFVQTQQRDDPEKWKRSAVLTERWRLIEGRELYDLPADASQSNDVSAQNAPTVAKLREEYERWWSSVSARFGEYSEILLGAPQAPVAELCCMDWHGPALPPWNQPMIQQKPPANGFWAVNVERPGRYEFILRQQPEVANHPVEAETARLQIGDVDETRDVKAGAIEVPFEVTLKAGSARLQTWLHEKGSARGAYYVTVRRLA